MQNQKYAFQAPNHHLRAPKTGIPLPIVPSMSTQNSVETNNAQPLVQTLS